MEYLTYEDFEEATIEPGKNICMQIRIFAYPYDQLAKMEIAGKVLVERHNWRWAVGYDIRARLLNGHVARTGGKKHFPELAHTRHSQIEVTHVNPEMYRYICNEMMEWDIFDDGYLPTWSYEPTPTPEPPIYPDWTINQPQETTTP